MAKSFDQRVPLEVEKKHHPDLLLPSNPHKKEGKKIILIGSSTGGVEALTRIFPKLPAGLPPIVIVQHIPKGFSTSFAQRLNSISAFSVIEVNAREVLKDSHAYLAPGDKHLVIENVAGSYLAKCVDGERISRHKPSVDVLFRSGNNAAGKNAMAIIMTGMGDDGSIGIKELFDNGAYTIAQNEASCVVFGMPKKAIEKRAVSEVVSLDEIPRKIIEYAARSSDKGKNEPA
ncbi:CheB methylesterase domain-containing protein [Wolinella succinogenes]|uniref:CheB methylesterase domain-containing protein n=1 Tax=Wolinella succinogenes TaxID=844 RepID=UPI00240A84B1|nr:CheB methylesterase domain-containing protein [Wolinella succinogenes]